jgi:hypothetical protein
MFKTAMQATIATLASLVFTTAVYAGVLPNLSVKMEQPKTPTNQNVLKLTVVTLDRMGADITVKCMKKAPSDGGFVQFGSDIAITPAGGNSVICETSPSFMNTDGTYQFEAIATSSETVTSNAVSVDYDTSGPETPSYTGKDRVNTCDYKVKFRTADDGGKTVKVEVYRSENTSFDANDGSRVDTITIGSNLDGSSTTTPPSCDKEYYFAIRAFDIAGNGSGVVGDSVVHTTSTLPASGQAGPSSGALQGAVAAGTAGNVLGRATGPTGGATEGSIMGDTTTPSAEVEYVAPAPAPVSKKVIALVGGVLILIGLAWYIRNKQSK